MKWQCDQQQQNTRHRQTKRKATGCRPVDQSASSTQQEQQNDQQSGTEASRQAKDRQTSKDQQKRRTAGRAASRAAERHSSKKPTYKCFTWNNGEHQKLSTSKKICREILIVSRKILIVGEDQRARFFLFL